MQLKKIVNKKPIIAILANLDTFEQGILAGSERIYVSRDYVRSVLKAGGIPLLLPIVPDFDVMQQQIDAVDAVVISGGQDVDPQHYAEEACTWLGATCPERDAYELKVVKYVVQQKKPLLGICRGQQLINVAFGGSLYQDIAQQFSSNALSHSQIHERHEVSHAVELKEDSWLFEVYKKRTIDTNSFHHQAVKALAPGFRVSCCSPDGVIEGIEKVEGSFVCGVQWHPEMMTEHHADMHRLFVAFIDVAHASIGANR
ncbi:MAG: gamma-glutamyl-gamma-aminobutyrate hydrolase family protein [Verrucomicrobia bacterium]|nr:gamma-glutamyl-gamma-aminobutyrate hydrolase family protein [Verrucomicrobiota bacterium]